MTSGRTSTGEAGFTLVELMLAMALSLIVSFAALSAFEAFDRGTASTNRLTAAQDAARRDVSRMVELLRDAGAPPPVSGPQPTTVTRASGNDIVFLSTAWPHQSATGTAGTHVERYCLDTTTHRLWFDGLRYGTTGPSDPGSPCPSTATGWTHAVAASDVVNNAAHPVFSYGSTNPVRSVGITLRLESDRTVSSRPLELSSGSALRGALASQVSAGDVQVECNYGGSGKALLSLGTNVKLAATGAVSLGPGQILVGTGASSGVDLTVTNLLGLQTLLFKPVSCP